MTHGKIILTVFYGLKLIIKSNIAEKDKAFIFLILTALGVYSIDANLNFPIARPQVLVNWAIIIALINNYIINYNKINKPSKNLKFINPLFLIFSFLFLTGCVYVTNTTYKKFGTAGYACPATGDSLSIPDSEDFNFGSGDFTIDAWLYRTGSSSYQTICSHKTDNSNYWQWRYFGGTGNFDFTVTGSGSFSVNWTVSAFAQDTWVHHQIVRNGNSWYLFQNGTQVGGTQTQAAAVPDMTGNLILQGDSSLGQPFVGYMDEIRISKGIARNTSNFVVPSNEYSQSRRLLSGSVDISGQPSGTNMKYKLETLNQSTTKETRVYGASMAWA